MLSWHNPFKALDALNLFPLWQNGKRLCKMRGGTTVAGWNSLHRGTRVKPPCVPEGLHSIPSG
jgi:hypothetical protein